jgi:peptidoglycan/xylan/chitin deacetylase (PgdA/CDA1 family)
VQALRPVLHRRGSVSGVVALTFDDGPSEWTDQVLDLLAEHDGRATFFLLGEAIAGTERERAARRVVEEGSEVGNHTFTHPQDFGALPVEQIRHELRATSERIHAVTGSKPRFWRAPHFGSSLAARAVAAGMGLREAGASVIPSDYLWPATLTAEFVLRRLEAGDIVDLHDGRPPIEEPGASLAGREETVRAVALILERMGALGLRSACLSEVS